MLDTQVLAEFETATFDTEVEFVESGRSEWAHQLALQRMMMALGIATVMDWLSGTTAELAVAELVVAELVVGKLAADKLAVGKQVAAVAFAKS